MLTFKQFIVESEGTKLPEVHDVHHKDIQGTLKKKRGEHYEVPGLGPVASKYLAHHHYSKFDTGGKLQRAGIVATHHAKDDLGNSRGMVSDIKKTPEHKKLSENGYTHMGHDFVSHPNSPPKAFHAGARAYKTND